MSERKGMGEGVVLEADPQADAAESLVTKAETLSSAGRAGVVALLEAFVMRGRGGQTFFDAMRTMSEDDGKDWVFAGNGTDGRMDHAMWLATDENGKIGKTLTVEQVLEQLR